MAVLNAGWWCGIGERPVAVEHESVQAVGAKIQSRHHRPARLIQKVRANSTLIQKVRASGTLIQKVRASSTTTRHSSATALSTQRSAM